MKRMELLAPAGGLKQLIAAVENGADAVYMGGTSFNARMKASNFTEEELSKGISYAHLRNVKVYITMNTLLQDEELLPALEDAAHLYELGADALILQDLGLLNLVKEYLPSFPIHLSTQGTVYNLSGVEAAKKLGASRVVLARETSLQEIKKITDQSACPIEVFVHGALCMCYSGQCQMSRVLGGGSPRSGNRGLCAQPCRLPYTDNRGETSYFLSPKDLCLIDHLPDLAKAGVTSLKIEGRMKSPEYVAIVTSIYRKYLDQYYDSGSYTVAAQDKEDLIQIYNRGGFTTGYLFENQGENLLSGEIPKHQGVFIGQVEKASKGSQLIDVSLKGDIAIGDIIEIRSKNIVTNRVTYKKDLGKGLVQLGDIKKAVAPGEHVYRITQDSLLKRARRTYDEAGFDGTKFNRKVPVEMELQVELGKSPLLTIKEGRLQVQVSDSSVKAEKAVSRSLTQELAERQLKKTGSTPFQVTCFSAQIEEGCSLSAASLNSLRRKGIQDFVNKKLKLNRKAELPQSIATTPWEQGDLIAFYFYDGSKVETYDFEKALEQLGERNGRAYVPLQYFMENPPSAKNIEFIPYILNISKGKLDQYIEDNFSMILNMIKPSGIAVGNLGWTQKFVEEGVKVYADYGLNLYNEKAAEAIDAMGLVPVCLSHETWDLEDGPIPLMITEHPMDYNYLIDRKDKRYKIVYNQSGDKWIILRDESCSLKKTRKKDEKKRWMEKRIYVV